MITTTLHPDIVQRMQTELMSAMMTGEAVVTIEDMTRKILYETLTAKLSPYTKGGQVVIWVPSKARFKVRIPAALGPDGKAVECYGKTDIEAMNKAYTALFGAPEKVTLASLWEEWLSLRKADLDVATSTIERDACLWKKHCTEAPIIKAPVQSLRASDIKGFYKSMTAGRAITRKELNNVKSIINSLLALALDRDIIQANPAACISTKDLKCKVVHSRDAVYTAEDRDALLAYLDAQEPNLYIIAISLMFCLDIRIGELKALTWDDYDEQAQTLRIEKQFVMRKEDLDNPSEKKHAILLDHTKAGEGGDRVLPVSPRAQKYLKLARQRRPFGKLILESEVGTPFRTNRFNERLKRYCEAAGVRYLSSHKIRFFAVTAQAASGIPLADIQYASGHKNPSTTYHYMRPQGLSSQRERWDEIFG